MTATKTTLPARYYTDPAVFARERERFFAEMWVAAAREEDIAKPGDFVVREVAGESVIVTRDESGALQAFYNVCRHRGTRICADEKGKFTGRIQCPYHAWTYALDGRLVAAPHMDDAMGFRCEDYRLGPVAIESWAGFVFVTLAPSPRPLSEQIGALARKFAPWRMDGLKRAYRVTYDVKANWKLVIQNYSECLHCPTVHPLLHRQSHYMSGENEPPRPTYLGGRMDLREGVQTLSMDGTSARACLPGLGAAERRQVYYYAVLPNLLLNLHPDYMLTFTMWPRAVDRTDVVCEWHFHPDAMAVPGFDPSDAVEFWDLTNRQDWELTERAHLGISTIGYRPGPYSNREDLLVGFDRFVLGRLASAAEGR